MNNQYNGKIETEYGLRAVLLCRDDDAPNQVMLHFWEVHGDAKRFAVLAVIEYSNTDQFSIKLVPIQFYLTNESGGLVLASYESAQDSQFRSYSVHLRRQGEKWEGEWLHTDGRSGRACFSPVDDNAELEAYQCKNWGDFKVWADSVRLSGEMCAFRGHGSNKFRLKTSLQRAGRYRLERYCNETLPEFATHVEALENKRFNLGNSEDYAMLLGLAQHHGLPTPLLDWTRSPYVAAFFAFVDALEWRDLRSATHVRIYGLAKDFLTESSSPIVTIPYIAPYVAPLHVGPLLNRRLYAQQGLFMVTNAVNVEHIFLEYGRVRDKNYLIAADIPINSAVEALADLRYMGLTAATMFPGLDGICRMMKHSMYSRAKSEVLA